MKYFLQKLTKQMLVVVILTVMASGSVWTYAAFVEPTVAPASSDQDFAQNVMGANNANNDFSSASVVSNADGSLLERLEYIATAIASLWTKSGDDLYYTTGNIGIGTTTPSSKLAVSGGFSVGANYNIAAPSNGAIIEGNVGIGTTNPGAKLEVNGMQNPELRLQSNSVSAENYRVGLLANYSTETLTLQVGATPYKILTTEGYDTPEITHLWSNNAKTVTLNNGNVGIGTTNPTATGGGNLLHLWNTGAATELRLERADGADFNIIAGASNAILGTRDAVRLDFKTNNAVQMSIDSTGNVGIGITNPTYKLQLNGQPAANGYTAWTNYSDRRLKDNITDIDYGSDILSKISQLHPVSFNYNELTGYDEETRSRRISGFIAQELQPIFPQMVATTTINGTEYLDTNLSDLPLYLVEGMKELMAENDELRNMIEELQIEVESLKNQ